MTKQFPLPILVLLLSITILAGCAATSPTPSVPEEDTPAASSEALSTESDGDESSADEESPDADPAIQPEPYESSAVFDVDVNAGTMTVEVRYTRDDRMENAFLLNRSLTVTKLICDGVELDLAGLVEQNLMDGRYVVNQYNLPDFAESLVVHYTGPIGNNPRYTTYVKEAISPDFTMLRWETLLPAVRYRLAKLVGTDVLDEATISFLAKYRDTPADFEILYREYTELCGKPELEGFFADWIYSTNGFAADTKR